MHKPNSSSNQDEKTADGPCLECRHETVICKDIVSTMRKFVRARGRTCDDVALVKLGIDGGGKCLKVMVQVLFKDDFLLQKHRSKRDEKE